MEDLYYTLNNLPDSYFEFVDSVMSYVKKKPERLAAVQDYIKSNLSASTSDILHFIMKQPDFFEDDVKNLSFTR